jgi:hypothetical protein
VAAWAAGPEADVEATFREAAAAGYPLALDQLAEWLVDRPGRRAEADRIRRYGP